MRGLYNFQFQFLNAHLAHTELFYAFSFDWFHGCITPISTYETERLTPFAVQGERLKRKKRKRKKRKKEEKKKEKKKRKKKKKGFSVVCV